MSREQREWIAEFVWAYGATDTRLQIRFNAVGSEEKAKARAASLIRQKYGSKFTINAVRPAAK